MTPDQHEKLKALNCCRLLPGSWDKRFIRNLAGLPLEHELTEKQAEMVEKLAFKYRRQIANQLRVR